MFTAPDGRLQPIWAFVFSALLSVAAFLIAGYASGAIAGEHVLRFEAVFRPLLVVLLLAIFSWLLSVGSHIEEHRIAAQGLPFLPGWPRQFALGCGIGFLLAIAYLRTKALWLPWGIHFAWNAVLGLLLGLPVSGLRLFNVAVHGTAIGPKWLTGGSYGIEASAPGALAIVAGLILIWKLPLSQIQRPSSLSRGGDRVEPSLPNVTN